MSDDRPHLLDLIRNNTFDVQLAAMLWLLVESKSSIISAAAPRLVGKTTLLLALVDFIPPRFRVLQTRGRDEDFSMLEGTNPASTYVIVPELSDHTPEYLWGEPVKALFEHLARGYSLAATFHADAPEVLFVALESAPVRLPRTLHHHVGAIANVAMVEGERGASHRLKTLTLVRPGPETVVVSEWDPYADTFISLKSSAARAAFEDAIGTSRFDNALGERVEILEGWLGRGPVGMEELRDMLAQYYQVRRL